MFTLRRGLRFSDGTPVRPTDLRASLERVQAATSLAAEQPNYFAGIVGAGRCMRRPVPCSLARGIEIDERARTVTIHLTRRTRTSCTSSRCLRVRRAGRHARQPLTGARAAGHRPLSRRHLGCEARRGARPQPALPARPPRAAGRASPTGSTSSIAPMRRRPSGSIAAVQRGAADVTVVAEPVLHPRSREPHPLAGRRSRRAGSTAVRRRPRTGCPSTSRRRAVRRRPRAAGGEPRDRPAGLVELLGGPEVGAPNCQFLPPAFPGYVPYCPYTAGPRRAAAGPRRTWSTPAGSCGVRARGRARHHPACAAWSLRRPVLSRRLLDELGFRTRCGWSRPSMRRPRRAGHADHHRPHRMGSRLPRPVELHRADTSRAAMARVNISRLCDRTLDRQHHAAAGAPQTDAGGAWAAPTAASSTLHQPCR